MADQVTVSTFLELKDNMSKGLKRLEALLRGIESAAGGAKVAVDSFNKTAQAAAAGIRLTRAVQDKAAKEAQAAQKQQELAEARHARYMRMAAERSSAFEARKAAKAQRESEREVVRKQRDLERMQRAHERLSLKQQQIAAKTTEFAARQEQKRRAAVEREATRQIRETARALDQRARLEQKSTSGSIRDAQRAAAARERIRQKELRDAQRAASRMARQQKQDDIARRRHISQMSAVLFGPSIGTAISAFGTPEAGPLAAIAAIETVISAIKSAISTTVDLIGKFNAKVFDVGKAYQDTNLRISMSLQSLGIAPSLSNARIQAESLYTTMRKLARDLPGETKDYMDVFSLALPMALHAGEKDLKRYATMVSKYTAFAFTRGVTDPGQIGRDLERMAQGRVLSTTRMFKELQPFIEGMPSSLADAVKQFNKIKDPAQQLKLVYAAIDNAAKGLDASADTASAKVGTLQDLIDQIFQYAGKPLFDSQLAVLDKINKYLIDNNTEITAFVRTISTYLGNALEGAAAKILEWADNFSVVKSQLSDVLSIFDKIAPLFGPLGMAYSSARVGMSAVSDVFESAEARGAKLRQEREEAQKAKIRVKTETVLEKYKDIKSPAAGAAVETQKAWAKAIFKNLPAEEAETLIKGRLGTVAPTIAEWFADFAEKPAAKTPVGAPKDRTKTINDFRFSRFDIKQEFAEGFDPDRIAVAFASDLARLGEFKVQSMNSPALTAAQ